MRCVIVRDIPDINDKSPSELGSVSVTSCSALGKVGHGHVQWQHSYIAEGKTFCIYLESEDAIREHASQGGFAVTSIHQVSSIIDPTGAAPAL